MKFVSALMEGKAILLCLMVIVQLGNSIHIEQCQKRIGFLSPSCTEPNCKRACQNVWGRDVMISECWVENPSTAYCYCVVCF
uniref:Knottin scorpion toxin-like domain-containing protein n=1 Tax=Aegilops tauschii subsp. strangulata TaxID=200361 RepID=A0A452XL69_AEGTS